MTGKKKSTFIQDTSVPDTHFFDTFGNGVNRKIAKPDLFKQIRDEAQTFIYPTVEKLQQANLEADPDNPIYVRVAENKFLLYQITSLEAGPNDIELDNGATATFQQERIPDADEIPADGDDGDVQSGLNRRVISLPDITALSSLDTAALVDGQQFSVGSYLPNTSTGSCLLRWRPDLSKSRHDGVLFFSLTVPMFTGTDTADYRNGVGETDPSGNGVMELVRGEIIYDHIALIPSVYASMPEVVESTFQRVRPAANSRIRIRFESGHEPTLGLSTEDGDYSKYIIESEDPSVTLAAGFSGVSVETTQSNAFIAGRNARMPELACLVDALDRCDVGYLVYGASSGYVSPGCGVERSAVFGFYVVNNGELSAPNTRWKEAGRGNRITTSSKGHVEGADMSGARALGISPEDTFGLDISRGSVANVMSQGGNVTDVSGSAGRGLTCRRSKVSGSGLRSGNCALEGVRLELGTEATLSSLTSNDNGGDGIFVTSGSSLSGQGIEALRNVGRGARFLNGSRGDMTASVIEDTDGVGLLIANGSTVNFRDGEVRRSTGNNIQLDDGGEINGVGAISEDAGNRGVAMNGGCSGNFRVATITGSANEDIRISRGCWVAASDCTTTSGPISTADTNLSAFNSLSGNGVIFA